MMGDILIFTAICVVVLAIGDYLWHKIFRKINEIRTM